MCTQLSRPRLTRSSIVTPSKASEQSVVQTLCERAGNYHASSYNGDSESVRERDLSWSTTLRDPSRPQWLRPGFGLRLDRLQPSRERRVERALHAPRHEPRKPAVERFRCAQHYASIGLRDFPGMNRAGTEGLARPRETLVWRDVLERGDYRQALGLPPEDAPGQEGATEFGGLDERVPLRPSIDIR